MLNLLYGYLLHTDYNFDTFQKESKGSYHISQMFISASRFLHVLQMEICYTYIRVCGHMICRCFTLYGYCEYIYLGVIVETEFVPGVLIKYEKQSDNERSDEWQINVQLIFIYTTTDSCKP